MSNFLKIAEKVDVIPLLVNLASHQELWNTNRLRKDTPGSPHAEADDVWLRFQDFQPDNPVTVLSDPITIPYAGWIVLTEAKDICLNVMRRVNGIQLGRVLITRLAPGKQIPLHKDEGPVAMMYQRFQLALQSGPGCVIFSGQEQLMMQPGEVWWMNNREPHGVVNNSELERLAMVIDVRLD